MRCKRQLLLAISHELRSPLTRVRVNAELLEASEPQQRIIEDLRQLEIELSELLETERLGSRHASLELESVAPNALIEAVLERHFPDTRLTRHHQNDTTPISLDGVRIRLMIRNLLENALRHTPDGAEPPQIHSGCERQRWEFSVEDHGSGIAAEHLCRLTEPFYRVDRARQRETGGYGLGLYLCRVIAEAHHGALHIRSEPGKGTRGTVIIPR